MEVNFGLLNQNLFYGPAYKPAAHYKRINIQRSGEMQLLLDRRPNECRPGFVMVHLT